MKARSTIKSGCIIVVFAIMAVLLSNPAGYVMADRSIGAENTGPKVTLNVDSMDIVQVLNAFSQQSGQSIVVGPDVKGTVTARLKAVPWREALEVIIEPYGYTYIPKGETVLIMSKDTPPSVSALKTEVYKLKFLDVADVIPLVENQLSTLGKLCVLGTQAERGWDFDSSSGSRSSRGGGASAEKRLRIMNKDEKTDFSKTLIVTDIQTVLDKVSNLINQLDVLPPQILIEARFVEVSADVLSDIGVEFGTGEGGASGALKTVLRSKGDDIMGLGAQQVSGSAVPIAFNAKGSGVNSTAPFNTGLSMVFEKLSGTEFEVLLHALEEDAKARTLSVPRILAVNNQEAAIIVGTKFPIIKSETSGQSATVSTSLEYYEKIGIQLNVVPQICGDGYIRMLVHPAVTDQTGIASAKTSTGVGDDIPLTEYPILSTREADTQIIIKSGETIVIGGLLADREVESMFKVPVLGSIPILGALFRRKTTNTEKVELVIFITASTRTPEEAAADADANTIARDRIEIRRSEKEKAGSKENAAAANVAMNEEAVK